MGPTVLALRFRFQQLVKLMILRGHIEDGKIVMDDDVALPDGTKVRIELVVPAETEAGDLRETSLNDRLKPLAGVAKGLPSDLAANHDHYIHGRRKP